MIELVLIGYDVDGKILPLQFELIGTNRSDTVDIHGKKSLQVAVDAVGSFSPS